MIQGELPSEPDDVRALRVDDDWWPKPPRGTVFRHSVGVRAVDPASWLAPREHDAALLAWRREMLDAAGDLAFGALPGSEAAAAQVLALVGAAAGQSGPGGAGHPLARAGRLVAEDLCLLDVSGPAPVLVAGSVAMPNRWRLADKLGHDLLGVHGPVPGYAEHIGTATDRLMQRLTGDRVMARTNWSITDRPYLFQPAGSSRVERARPDVVTGPDAAQGLYVRVEYQTVRAVPGHPAVLFTIRTARELLGALADRPQVAATLLAVIEQQPPGQRDYKGVAPYLAAVQACLRSLARLAR